MPQAQRPQEAVSIAGQSIQIQYPAGLRPDDSRLGRSSQLTLELFQTAVIGRHIQQEEAALLRRQTENRLQGLC